MNHTNETLNGLKVAILVTDGFEQVEVEWPWKALDEAGAQTRIVSPKAERVRAWKFREWGDQLRVDVPLDQAKPQDFDALLLPGDLVNLDALRVQPRPWRSRKHSPTLASRWRRSAVTHGPSLRSTRLAAG
jgi:protease I